MIRWNSQELLIWLTALIPLFILSGFMIRRRTKLLERMAAREFWSTMLPGYSSRRQRQYTEQIAQAQAPG